MSKRFLVPLLMSLATVTTPAVAATVTLTTVSNQTSSAGPSTVTSDTEVVSSLPFSGSTLAINGIDSSETSYNFSNNGFFIDIDHARDGDFNHWAKSEGFVWFTVDQDVDYTIAGFYNLIEAEARPSQFGVFLQDLTTSAILLSSDQQSNATANESYVVGGSGGDMVNTFIGSQTGTLTAGHDYVFAYGATTANVGVAQVPNVTGIGYVSLTLVPEPSSASFVAIGAVATLVVRRRRSISA